PRPARRRGAALRPRPRGDDRRRPAAAGRVARGGRDPRVRGARRRARRGAPRRPATDRGLLAVEPRPGSALQGAAAPPHAHGLLLGEFSESTSETPAGPGI